jgi:hypothetical protein
MAMYAAEASYGDFEFHLDDFLIGRLINPKLFSRLTEKNYAVLRATVRSELLHSKEVAAAVKPKIGALLTRAKSLRDANVFGMPGAAGPQYGGGLREVAPAGRPGVDPGQPAPERSVSGGGLQYGGGFFGFDDTLLDRLVPARQLASLKSHHLAALASLVKAELLYSVKVHKHLEKRIRETLKEMSSD